MAGRRIRARVILMDDGGGSNNSGGGGRLLKLKIAKNAYVFDVKKKYAATRNFNLKKGAQTPADEVKQAFSSLFGKKPPTGGAGKPLEAPRGKGRGIPTPLLVAAIAFLLFFLAVGVILLQFGGAQPKAPPAQAMPGFSGAYSYAVQEATVLSAGSNENTGATQRTAYFLISYGAQNLTALNFSASLYSARPSLQVFVLEYAKDGAYMYPIFRSRLSDKLSSLGLSVNDISVSSLSALPQGAILLVPTGYFPSALLDEGPSNYKGLLARGVDIVYIGRKLDTMALGLSGNSVQVSVKDFKYVGGRESSGGFELYDPQYFVDGSEAAYGSVSLYRTSAGTMAFLPQTLDGGWISDDRSEGPEKAASDLARLLSEQPWRTPFAQAQGPAGLWGPNQSVASFFTGTFPFDAGYTQIAADAHDLNGARSRSLQILRVQKPYRGEITVRDARAVPYFLSGQRTRFNMKFNEDSPDPVKLYIAMYLDGAELQRSELEFGLTNPQSERSADFPVEAPPGAYVVRVVDADGKVYAATELEVIGMDVRMNKSEWAAGRFAFLLSAGGKPINPRYMNVTLDGKHPKEYASIARVGDESFIEYRYPAKLDSGIHNFTFGFGAWSKQAAAAYYRGRNFWEDPTVLFLGALSLCIFVIGYLIKRPEAVRYGLDIPDFLPITTTKIPVKRETVLDIFDNVNAGYSWKWMPLRAEEIKNGFRKLTYNGKPILVGDFNLDRLLTRLKEEGLVKSELDYWGLSRWEGESKRTIRYLTIYRVLRNVFVNNAVKFSRLDAMPDCDVKAIVGKEEVYLHVMEEPAERVVHRALATAKKGTTIIVFITQEEADAFFAALTSTSKLAVGLKMEVQNRNILLLPVKQAITAYLKQKSG